VKVLAVAAVGVVVGALVVAAVVRTRPWERYTAAGARA
jgi:hypothetical protein